MTSGWSSTRYLSFQSFCYVITLGPYLHRLRVSSGVHKQLYGLISLRRQRKRKKNGVLPSPLQARAPLNGEEGSPLNFHPWRLSVFRCSCCCCHSAVLTPENLETGTWEDGEKEEKFLKDSPHFFWALEVPFSRVEPELAGFFCISHHLHRSAHFWIFDCVEFRLGYTRGKNVKFTAGSVILWILVLFPDPPVIFTFQGLQIVVDAFCPSFIVQWEIKEVETLLFLTKLRTPCVVSKCLNSFHSTRLDGHVQVRVLTVRWERACADPPFPGTWRFLMRS